MSSPTSPTLPQRSGTIATRVSTFGDEEALPTEDTSEVTKLFLERLQAWKHACGYLEDYITVTEKLYHSHGKEYEKVLKTVTHPLREGHHFEQSLGGIAGFFDNIRSNTQVIANSYTETAKTLKGSVLPTFERLHAEIKSKNKELTKGAGKGSKAVDKARAATQKHVELLGQHTAGFEAAGGKISASEDPYLLRRGVLHRLNKQILEENANRQDILAVQNNFASFEAHVIQTLQSGMGQFHTVTSKQADLTKSLYGDIVSVAQQIPADFEWINFLHRNDGVLIDPDAPARSIDNVTFPNQDHRATQPLISGSLDRRGKLLRKYDTNYYVVTPSKYFHEFKSDDDFAKEPTPELTLYLPDCAVGAIDGEKFDIKGKDVSGGKIGSSMSISHNYSFKAHNAQNAAQWWELIRTAAGQITFDKPELSVPNSPISPSSGEGEKFGAIDSTGHSTGTTGTSAEALPAPTAADEKAAIAAKEKEEAHAAALTAESTSREPKPTVPVTSSSTPPAAPAGTVSTSAGPGEAVTTQLAKA